MPPEVLAMLGLSAEATPEQIQAAIQEQRKTAAATERTNMLAALGLSEEPGKPADLQAVAAQAKDGVAYREAQLDRLHALTITMEGNDEAGVESRRRCPRGLRRAKPGAHQRPDHPPGSPPRHPARRAAEPHARQPAAAASTQKLKLSAFGLGGKR